MGCGTRLVKMLMFVANALFAVAGLTLIAFASYVRAVDNDYNSVFGKGGPFAPANIMIAAGVIVFLISFMGCYGAIKECKYVLVMFIVFIVIVLLCETALIVLAFVYRSEAKRYATDAIVESIRDFYDQSGQSGVTSAVNKIQTDFKCCGANNYTDWLGSKWAKSNPGLRVPKSCCISTPYDTCQNATKPVSNIHTKSCATELADWAKNNLAIVGGLAAGVLTIELLAILFAAILISRKDNVAIA